MKICLNGIAAPYFQIGLNEVALSQLDTGNLDSDGLIMGIDITNATESLNLVIR